MGQVVGSREVIPADCLRLLTWNLNRRRRIGGQAAAIASRTPDIIALQELTLTSTILWRTSLAEIDLRHVTDSFAASPLWDAVGPRRYGLLIASRFPLISLGPVTDACWPERILSASVTTPKGLVTVHTTHVPPGSSNGWIKVQMLEAAAAIVSAKLDLPCVLCGDFNTPQVETPHGRIVTWAERIDSKSSVRVCKRKRGEDARRWDDAERSVLQGGKSGKLIDAYRHLHGYARQEYSWFVKRGRLVTGRRFDHVFCSRDMMVNRCEYLHSVREQGLSDHSALELDFEF
jgi:exonuclease III